MWRQTGPIIISMSYMILDVMIFLFIFVIVYISFTLSTVYVYDIYNEERFRDSKLVSAASFSVIDLFIKFHINQNSSQIDQFLKWVLSKGGKWVFLFYSNLTNLTCHFEEILISPLAKLSFKIWFICLGQSMCSSDENVYDVFFYLR